MKALRILLADDSEDVCTLVTLRAAKLGHSVETVRDGHALLTRVKVGPSDFDVVVTDNDMPGGIDGLLAISVLRSDRRFRSMSLILHTNNPDPKLKLQIEDDLDAMFALKGFSFEELFRALDVIAER